MEFLEAAVNLSEAQLTDMLSRVTYKPGWQLSIIQHPFEGLQLRVVATVDNSYDPSSTTDLGISTFIPPMQSAGQFYTWVLWRLLRIEIHETREWFKVDGKAWSDPHKDAE